MKIAINLVYIRHSCGIGKSLLYLMTAVHKKFPDVEFVTFTRRSFQDFSFPFPVKKLVFHNNIFSRLWLRLKLRGCDFMHYHYNGAIINNQKRGRNVVVLHDILPYTIPDYFKTERKRQRWYRYTQRIIRNSNIILTPSDFSRMEILDHFKCDKPIHVLYNGVTIPDLPHGTEKEDYYIYAGGYDRRKGLVSLLRTFINSPVRRRLVFVGRPKYISAEFQHLVERATNMGILTEMGRVSDAELAVLIARARASIYPSKDEGFGLPPIEAMKLGTVAITTPFSSMPEICGDAALYFDPDKEGDLGKLLEKIDADPNILTDMQEKGAERIKKFDFDNIADEYMQILKSFESNGKKRFTFFKKRA